MGKSYWGPSMLVALSKDHWNLERFRTMFRSLLDKERMGRRVEGWMNDEWATKEYQSLVNKDGLPRLNYYWFDPNDMDGPVALSLENCTNLYFNPVNRENFRCGDAEILLSYTFSDSVPVTDNYKVGYMLRQWRKVIQTLEPEFAAIDHYQKNMKKREGKDIRRFAWAAMYYGPEMVARVGVEKIAHCPYIYTGDELLSGGLFFRAENNPFLASKEKLKALEKHLELPKLFPAQ